MEERFRGVLSGLAQQSAKSANVRSVSWSKKQRGPSQCHLESASWSLGALSLVLASLWLSVSIRQVIDLLGTLLPHWRSREFDQMPLRSFVSLSDCHFLSLFPPPLWGVASQTCH